MSDGSVQLDIIAIDSASNIIEGITEKFGVLGGIAAAGIGAVASAMGDLIKSGSKAQDAQAMFNAVLDNSPLKDYKTQMLSLAEAYSKTTRFENDNIVAAETVLARYQNLGRDVMPQAVKTTLDLATLMKTDASSAAEQLGKALEDISGGSLGLLARTRLLSKEEKQHAEEMAKTGDAAGAQAYILGILDQKTGGLAQKMGTTYAGQMQIFNNTINELKESLGMKLLPLLTPIVTKITELVNTFAPMLENINWENTGLGKFLRNLAEWWRVNGPQVMSSAQMVFGVIQQAIGQLAVALGQFIGEQLEKFNTWFTQNGPLITEYISRFGMAFNAILPIIIGAIYVILTALGWIITGALSLVTYFMQFSIWWQNLWIGFMSPVKTAVDFIIGLINKAITVIKTLASVSLSIGGIKIPGKAAGGPASGMTWVGENGPELVNLPTGSFVHSNRNSQGMGGGGGSYNITVNNPNPERASDSIQRVLKNLNYLGLPA